MNDVFNLEQYSSKNRVLPKDPVTGKTQAHPSARVMTHYWGYERRADEASPSQMI